MLWGFTAVLGNLIDLSAAQVVFIRSSLAALILAVMLRRFLIIDRRLAMALIGNGMLLGAHWVLFFLAVKISTVSICMVGMATVSFWTAVLEPMMIAKQRWQGVNLILGLVVVGGVYLIYRGETQFHAGIVVASLSALLACVFSIFNGGLSGHAGERVIVMYEMAGSAIFCALALGLSEYFGWGLASDRWFPTLWEWGWIAILVLACTIYAYQVYVELLKRLSVFTINFANNLEPVYGILLGSLLFRDHQRMGASFFAGTAIIVVAVIAQPWLERRQRQRR
ncbi:DMT family transporter [Stieleria varia]|uniref:DMT family transporter n=1 Tax=Stieleria varia TaxID=2528005 RepID=UPI001E469AFC|nr:EamA family transporter [Stieleria varia]